MPFLESVQNRDFSPCCLLHAGVAPLFKYSNVCSSDHSMVFSMLVFGHVAHVYAGAPPVLATVMFIDSPQTVARLEGDGAFSHHDIYPTSTSLKFCIQHPVVKISGKDCIENSLVGIKIPLNERIKKGGDGKFQIFEHLFTK